MLSSSAAFSFQPSAPGQQYLNTSQVADFEAQAPVNTGSDGNPAADASVEQQWRLWIDAETRRRLLVGCFYVDAHTSIYHEQARVRHFDLSDGRPPPISLTGPSTPLWNAPSADAFALALQANPTAATPTSLPSCDDLTAGAVLALAPFDRALLLVAEAIRLPRRASARGGDMPVSSASSSHFPSQHPAEANIRRLFPSSPVANTYLALHHTPLLDLLAVSGDSWVFSHKILPESSFREHKKRLKAWAAAGAEAPLAASHAARALRVFLARPPATTATTAMDDMSEYWAAYVCALVCWAFGHRAARPAEAARGVTDSEVIGWLQSVVDMRPDEVARLRGRREALGVVGLLRRHLEIECVGGRNRLFVDAMSVLKKLEEGMNWKWF